MTNLAIALNHALASIDAHKSAINLRLIGEVAKALVFEDRAATEAANLLKLRGRHDFAYETLEGMFVDGEYADHAKIEVVVRKSLTEPPRMKIGKPAPSPTLGALILAERHSR